MSDYESRNHCDVLKRSNRSDSHQRTGKSMDTCILYFTTPDQPAMVDFSNHFSDPEQNSQQLSSVTVLGKSMANSCISDLTAVLGDKYLMFGECQLNHGYYRFSVNMWAHEQEPGLLEKAIFILVSAISDLDQSIDIRCYGISNSEQHYFFIKGRERKIAAKGEPMQKLDDMKKWFSEGLPLWLQIINNDSSES